MEQMLNIDYSLSEKLNLDKLKEYKILPIKKESLFITVALCKNSIDKEILNEFFDFPVKTIMVSQKLIEDQLLKLPQNIKLFSLASYAVKKDQKDKFDTDITNFLDYVLVDCVENGISDIHIELMQHLTIIRVRLNGVLENYFSFDKKLFYLLSSSIKLLGNLDISQKRHPLNSRFSKKLKSNEYDFRISTIPTIYGESIVLRVLDNQNIKKKLHQIGFKESSLQIIKKTLKTNQGLILVTGPTGSGKTTTLYSMLDMLNTSEKKIITVEDPVEYKLNGVVQVNINQDIDLDFSTVLKNILRQDPDILMIGEIRDKESLDIALRASLTGHLVIATLHTNNTIETITRLLDLQAAPYLISSTLKLIISQRLIRKLCKYCNENGCIKCNYKSFNGRTIVEEILLLDENIKKLLNDSNDTSKIKEYLQNKGFTTLSQNAYELVKNGITTLKEVESKL